MRAFARRGDLLSANRRRRVRKHKTEGSVSNFRSDCLMDAAPRFDSRTRGYCSTHAALLIDSRFDAVKILSHLRWFVVASTMHCRRPWQNSSNNIDESFQRVPSQGTGICSSPHRREQARKYNHEEQGELLQCVLLDGRRTPG